MQIICIYTGVSPFEQKLDYVFNVFKNTLNELGVKISVLDISKLDIGYYNGIKQPIIENIFNHMKNAQGIIFASTAQRYAVNGVMQVFLEHLDYNIYKDVLTDKPCMSIITSSDNSEYMAGNYMSMLISSLGGTNLNSMLIGKDYLTNIEISDQVTEMIEKYAEDFYRFVKQNRKFFTATPFVQKPAKQSTNTYTQSVPTDLFETQSIPKQEEKHIRNLSGEQVANLYKKEVENTIDRTPINIQQTNVANSSVNQLLNQYKNQQNVSAQTNNYNFERETSINNYNNDINYNDINYNNQFKSQPLTNSFNQVNETVQDEDISQIAKLLGQKYEEDGTMQRQISEYMKKNISPSISSLKQKTQSLHHYFQPQMANGINVTMQVSISGKENFNGYFIIKDGDCRYYEGIAPSADVSIISDSLVWEEVIGGKCTLQKAFMLGRLKVKGNFVIISKFEQFFKIV